MPGEDSPMGRIPSVSRVCSSICIRVSSETRQIRIAPVIILAMMAFALVVIPAMAGTETGEFCATCPDWTDLDGWMAKKQTYEQQEMEKSIGKSGAQSSGGASPTEDQKPVVEARYPNSGIITEPGAGIHGKIAIDARSPEDYSQGHLFGARNIYWKDMQHSGMLDIAAAEKNLQKAGINNSDDVLVYGGSDGGPEFVFWALSYLGHGSVSLLDGGIDAASGAGMSLDRSDPQVPESSYIAHPVQSMLVDEMSLESALAGNIQVLDARDFSDYGLSRLTGSAMQISTDKLRHEGLTMAGPEDLEKLFEGRGLDRKRPQIVYGTPKAYLLFYALDLMGYNASLIEGSWWSKTKLAISNVR